MIEERVKIESGSGCLLDGRLSMEGPGPGVVITHPHPLYGGDMFNGVVETIRNACARKGYATLRFNFRGVGRSTGTYDEGEGEQQDVAAACAFMNSRGAGPLVLAGYSFGAWVNAHAAAKLAIDQMILISPPVAMLPFKRTAAFGPLTLVVAGGRDEFAPSELLAKQVPEWNPSAKLVILEEADHFYFGHTDDLEGAISENLRPAGLPV